MREVRKMMEVVHEFGAEDLEHIRNTLNTLGLCKRLWQAIKLIAGKL